MPTVCVSSIVARSCLSSSPVSSSFLEVTGAFLWEIKSITAGSERQRWAPRGPSGGDWRSPLLQVMAISPNMSAIRLHLVCLTTCLCWDHSETNKDPQGSLIRFVFCVAVWVWHLLTAYLFGVITRLLEALKANEITRGPDEVIHSDRVNKMIPLCSRGLLRVSP